FLRHADQGDSPRRTYYASGRMPRRAWIFAISTSATLFAFAPAAVANGRFPATSMLVQKPGDPSHLALRATFGVVLSNDGGKDWDWICERAMGFGGSEDPSLLITGSGAILVGTFAGMRRSTDGGCHFAHDASWPANVIDLTARPAAPDRVYAVSSRFSSETDAGNAYASQLFVSNDAGATWSLRSTLDPSLLIDSVEVAPSDPERVYVSAVRPEAAHVNGVLLESDDDGAHWMAHKISLEPAEQGLYVAAVDPKNASRVYLRTSGTESGRVFATDDAGKTVSVPFLQEKNALSGFALADGGATIYAGGFGGVWSGASKDGQLTKASSTHVQCLASIGSALWSCTPASEGYVLGTSIDHGVKFAPALTLSGMRGPLQCAPPSDMDGCAADWPALRDLVGGSKEVAAKPAPATKRWFGCSASPGNSGPLSPAALTLAIGLAFFSFRRAARRVLSNVCRECVTRSIRCQRRVRHHSARSRICR
ncbi:MAG: WD40/YVTN/BNR-like repeat-containing protein, partial [Polyangiaceae bacterium]